MVLGIITVMHILREDEAQVQTFAGSSAERVLHTLRKVGKPCFFASLTTMLGFLSVLITDMAILRQFGLFTALGIFFTFLFSFYFSMLILPMRSSQKNNKGESSLGRNLARFVVHIFRWPAFYWLLLCAISMLSLLGIKQIQVDMFPISYFPEKHPLVQAHHFFLHQWGPYYPVDLTVQTDSVSVTDPLVVKAIYNFEQEAKGLPHIHQTMSFVQALNRFSQVMYQQELPQVLSNPMLAKSFARHFKRLVAGQEQSFISQDQHRARLTLIGPMLSIGEMEKALVPIQAFGKKHFHPWGELQLSGYPALFLQAMNYAFSSMAKSLLLFFVLVSLTLGLMLRNLRLALIVLLPNVFPVLVLLGALGLLGINLDLATATITAIIFGVVVDDSIHFLFHFRQEQKMGFSTEKAIQNAQRKVGEVIMLSSLLLMVGFSLMMLASLKTVFYFGLLSVISVLAALLGDLILLPLLLKRWF